MLVYYIIVPILTAVFLYLFCTAKAARVIAILIQGIFSGFAVHLFFLSKEGDIVTRVGNFTSVMGITLKVDMLAGVFVMLTAFIFLIAAIYSFNEDNNRLYWFFMFIWQALLLGVFMTRDFFNLFIMFEVMTVIVAVLIMFKRDKRSMYDGILYLLVNGLATQFYLLGLGYIYKLAGSLDMDAIAPFLLDLDRKSLILPYALIISAVSVKCALVPVFSWLPKAHGAPGAPPAVSAILSGLHIKCAVFIFIRVQEVFKPIALTELFLVIGIVTSIVGFMMALSQLDIKLILAYHTISQIGLIMIGLSIGNTYTFTGGVYHIINHAFFKAALFMCAGIIYETYGTKNIYKIHGVLKRLPLVGITLIMASLGITGAPFFNGSISKYFIMYDTNEVMTVVFFIINLGTIISFVKYSTMLYEHHKDDAHKDEVEEKSVSDHHTEVKPDMFKQVAAFILGLLCLVGGIFGEGFIWFLFDKKLSVDPAGYIQKSITFLVTVAAGHLIYKYYVKKSKLFVYLRGIELNFRQVCICIGGFIALVMITAKMMG